jgi:hypothetical protein
MATEGDHGLLRQLQADITAVFTVLLHTSVVCAHARIYKTRMGLLGSAAAILHADVVSSANNDEEQKRFGKYSPLNSNEARKLL